MEREVSTLRGDNEKLRNEVENLQKDQKDRFTQVDEKMDKLKDTAKPTDIRLCPVHPRRVAVVIRIRLSRMRRKRIAAVRTAAIALSQTASLSKKPT